MATKSTKLLSSKFVEGFYGITENEERFVAFEPTKVISSAKLKEYLSGKDYLTEEQKKLLCYVFGDEDEPSINHDDDILANCMCDILISPTAKNAPTRKFYILSTTIKKHKQEKNGVANFIYLENQTFQGMYMNAFSNCLQSVAFDQEKRTYDKDFIEEIERIADSEEWKSLGYELVGTPVYKSSKLSLSKVIISLVPNLATAPLGALTDFINSEMLSRTKGGNQYSNVYELKGDLITYFYNCKNYRYQNDGSLGSSCMRGDGQTEQIKFYANNATSISMLAYIVDKQLLARTILWTDVTGKKYCDRIYHAASNYGTILAAYCKKFGYRTVYNSTGNDHGIPYDRNCIVKLDSYELKRNNYPYLDSMYFIDLINGYLCPEIEPLRTYLLEKNIPFLIKCIQRSGPMGQIPDRGDIVFSKGEAKSLQYLKDGQGQEVNGHLSQYAVIKKPVLSIVPKDTIITINDVDKVDSRWCEKTLLDKYNSIKPTLLHHTFSQLTNRNFFSVRFYDKQFVVYSGYHKIYIRKRDAVFVNRINSYVLKTIIQSKEFQRFLRLSKLRSLFGGKLVKISSEGLEDIKRQLSLLPFHESVSDIRSSRIYSVKIANIHEEGVKIKGLIVPYKHLRFVKNGSRKNQK